MQPPEKLNVLDSHGGFTAEITETDPDRAMKYGTVYTLWRPGSHLKKKTEGTLQSFNERSFYQTNNDVTQAVYKVPGYKWPVICWFDNATGKRIA
jgi:hypothetical protein